MYDVFSCSEIHNCSENIIKDAFPEHEVYLSKRKTLNGGGISVFVRKIFKQFVSKIDIQLDECIVLHIKHEFTGYDKDLICCFPYIPHEYSTVFYQNNIKGMERFINLFNSLSLRFGDVYWLIGGDLNARTGTLRDTIQVNNLDVYINAMDGASFLFDNVCIDRKSRDPNFINSYGRQLIEFLKCNSLCIVNGRTQGDNVGNITCIANKGKSIVDYCIISRNIHNFVNSFNVIPRTESDHFPITISISCSICKDPDNVTNDISCHVIQPLYWKPSLTSEYMNDLTSCLKDCYESFMNYIDNNDLDSANLILKNCISSASTNMQSNRKNNKNRNSQPKWWDKDLDALKTIKYQNLHKFHFTNNDNDLEAYIQSKRNFKNTCVMKQKENDKNTIDELIKQSKEKNSHSFWDIFKTMLSNKTVKENNILPKEWFTYFNDLYNPKQKSIQPTNNLQTFLLNDDIINDGTEQMLNMPISLDEIDDVLDKLKVGKASGSDGIGPDFYKVNCVMLREFLSVLFNKVYESNIYPKEWSKSLIVPLHKKGNSSNVQNYRGISLLNIISKIFSSILYGRLLKWCDDGLHMPESQTGGRKGYSTLDNIFCLQALTQKYISKNKGRFYVLFVDFSKAYDSVPRTKLWEILISKGLKGKLLETLQSMHSNILSSVRIGKTNITDFFSCPTGLRQGCILSTLLFSLYVSKLEIILRESGVQGIETLPNDVSIFLLMYIDDLCIFSDNAIDLQRKIKILDDFCSEWGMNLNMSKTKIIVFRNGGILKHFEKWFYRGNPIEIVTYYSYLGILVSSRLCWSKCVNELSCKAQQIVSRLRYLCNRYDYFTRQMLFTIFDTKVKPVLLYGSEIWGVRKFDDVEQVHIHFCKVVLNVGKTTRNFAAYGECGRYPLYVDYHCKAIKFWCNLIVSEDNKYVSKCYKLLHRHDTSGRRNWASDMRILLSSLGFGYAWYAQSVGDTKYFLQLVKQRLLYCSRQEWYTKVNLQCPEYLDFHPTPFAAPHIELIQSYNKKRIFSLLRTFSLPLKNNLLRLEMSYNNLCEKCSGVYVENEFHFLLRCSAYNDLRIKYIPELYRIEPSLDKLYKLLATNNVYTINSVIEFTIQALGTRLIN